MTDVKDILAALDYHHQPQQAMDSITKDSYYMQHCLVLAKKSLTAGDLPFGALIVYKDAVLAESTNTGLIDITGHAEINVIRKALSLAPRDTAPLWTLYTNMEPCAMCSFIVRDFGIGRVVYAAHSPFWGGQTRWDILADNNLKPEFTSNKKSNPPEVTAGVLKDEADAMFDALNWVMHKKNIQ